MVRMLLFISLVIPGTLDAQTSLEPQFDEAWVAWDRGSYPTALRGFRAVLDAPGGDRFAARVALLTGELFHTIEIAPDGTAPSWSHDGRFFVFSAPSSGSAGSHVVSVADGIGPPHPIPGRRVRIAPDGRRAVSLRLRAGPDLDRARDAARRSIQVRTRADFAQRRRAVARVDAQFTEVLSTDLTDWISDPMALPGLAVFEAEWSEDGTLYLVATRGDQTATNVYRVVDNQVHPVTEGDLAPSDLHLLAGGRYALHQIGDGTRFGLLDLTTGMVAVHRGTDAVASADGSTVAFAGRDGDTTRVSVLRIAQEAPPTAVFRTTRPIANLAVSPTGDRVVFQIDPRENWELMVVDVSTGKATQLTHEIQHDLYPRFLDDTTVLAVMGEGRHRRSYLYDLTTGERSRFFHNNTIRTVAPEYEWAASPDGSTVLIVAERDGDTISPERGIYLVDRRRTVSTTELRARLARMLTDEERLRTNGQLMFTPIAETVREVVADVSTTRIYAHARELFSYGSKFITQPGNAHAIEYLASQLRLYGYEPELQWFEPRRGVRSANVIATLRGTRHPQLRYVVSSHFDSVERGPGADDNSSGTTALLEAARVLANRPQAATIQFAFFTGEEAGLLGSREFVRRAVADGHHIVGALNNDMVGYANDNRLDNTIRYSNAGIRDVQHAAAFLFTDLITYDAKYYKSTDAHAYYEEYGDIVGGIGSYPILGNPHYHQTHDVLETINQQLVAEVSKTTVATLMLLASSPSRVTEITLDSTDRAIDARWTPSPESDVTGYVVEYERNGMTTRIDTQQPAVTLPAGGVVGVRVKAVNRRGFESWDWGKASPTEE